MKWYNYLILFAVSVFAGITVSYVSRMIDDKRKEKETKTLETADV